MSIDTILHTKQLEHSDVFKNDPLLSSRFDKVVKNPWTQPTSMLPSSDVTTSRPRRNIVKTINLTNRRKLINSHMLSLKEIDAAYSEQAKCPVEGCVASFSAGNENTTVASTVRHTLEAIFHSALKNARAIHIENPINDYHVYADPNQIKLPTGQALSW